MPAHQSPGNTAAPTPAPHERRQRRDHVDATHERTDDLIDDIVYELYGLTDEEIEIVKETVAD